MTSRPPEISSQALSTLLTELYPFESVDTASIDPLPSYEDRNYYFRADQEELVLKLANPILFPAPVLEGCNAVMLFLKQKEFKCIHPLRLKNKDYLVEISRKELLAYDDRSTSEDGLACHMRVMTFIPGVIFDEVDQKFLPPDLVYCVGNYIGMVDSALQEFEHPALQSRKLAQWDLSDFLSIQNLLSSIQDHHKRQLAESIFTLYKKHVLPRIPELRRGMILGDASGSNVVLQKDSSTDSYSIAGLIDFGHCLVTCYVFEIAVTLAYAMMGRATPVEFVGPMLRGYLHAFPLGKAEMDCLYYLVLVRCCQSAMIGEHRFTLEPWNDFFLATPAKAWRVIELLLATPKEIVDKAWGDREH